MSLKSGDNVFDWMLPEVKAATSLKAEIQFNKQTMTTASFQESPARPMTIYVLPHSHTDIGYVPSKAKSRRNEVKDA